MKEYEALLILPAKLDDEAVKKAMQTVSDEIVTQGGSVSNYDVMGKKVFARQLKKQSAGTYVKVKFTMPAAGINGLISRLKFNDDVFRIQITSFDPIVAAAKEAAKVAAAAKRAAMEVASPVVAPVATPEVVKEKSE
ncbi:MAG: 30S ribosomal protein S6 [Kiritimatiellae bacterium]|nr:30S ribosomal protein S6 [Kiritimatiellia bacterium]